MSNMLGLLLKLTSLSSDEVKHVSDIFTILGHVTGTRFKLWPSDSFFCFAKSTFGPLSLICIGKRACISAFRR